MGYILLNVALAVWMFLDGSKRKMNAIPWCLGTVFLGFLTTPVYMAKRNLKSGEKREGGMAWNVLKNFALFWTITIFIVTMYSVFGAASSIDPTTDAEKAGAGIGIMLGLGLMFFVWFIPMIGAVVLGVFLKKSNEIEVGPTGALAN